MVIAWQVYERTGDVSILQHFYPGLRGWVDCLLNLYKASGLTGLPSYWGDWEATGRNTNGSLVSAFPFLRDVRTLVSIAVVLEDDAAVQHYNATYNNLTAEFHATFYRPDLLGYGDGSQAGNVLALATPGVVPDELRAGVVKSLVADIQARDAFYSVGIVSIAQLFPVLSSNGHHDLALHLAQQTKYPSYGQPQPQPLSGCTIAAAHSSACAVRCWSGWMFSNPIQNATTTWEAFNVLPDQSGSSLNHHMFNTIGSWFYRYVAGIVPGVDSLLLHPRLPQVAGLLRRVQAELSLWQGEVLLDWERDEQQEAETGQVTVRLQLQVPHGLKAQLRMDSAVQHGSCRRVSRTGQGGSEAGSEAGSQGRQSRPGVAAGHGRQGGGRHDGLDARRRDRDRQRVAEPGPLSAGGAVGAPSIKAAQHGDSLRGLLVTEHS